MAATARRGRKRGGGVDEAEPAPLHKTRIDNDLPPLVPAAGDDSDEEVLTAKEDAHGELSFRIRDILHYRPESDTFLVDWDNCHVGLAYAEAHYPHMMKAWKDGRKFEGRFRGCDRVISEGDDGTVYCCWKPTRVKRSSLPLALSSRVRTLVQDAETWQKNKK